VWGYDPHGLRHSLAMQQAQPCSRCQGTRREHQAGRVGPGASRKGMAFPHLTGPSKAVDSMARQTDSITSYYRFVAADGPWVSLGSLVCVNSRERSNCEKEHLCGTILCMFGNSSRPDTMSLCLCYMISDSPSECIRFLFKIFTSYLSRSLFASHSLDGRFFHIS
jgi:hypothetical protein